MALMTRTGFGQVEPNHLSAQRTAQIYAQLPAADEINILENGQFVKYDYANEECNFSGKGQWMMVFNEVKLYDEWRESYKDFAMKKENYTPGGDITHDGLGPFKGQMVPRVIKINVGDIWTTNALVGPNTSGKNKINLTGFEQENAAELLVGQSLKVNSTNGFLELGEDENFEMQIVKVYTMADGQPAVKVMRIK